MAGNSQNPEAVNERAPLLAPDSTLNNVDDQTCHDALEREPSPEEQKIYEGLPEVKKRMKYIFPAMAVGVFLAAADKTIIASSYSRIGSDLNALSQTSWIATAYVLTLTSFQPLYGKLGDIFGRKSCLLFAYVVFGMGCLGCGAARNMGELIAARAVSGIGGGGLTTIVSILLTDVIGRRERGTWQGYVNVIYAAGASIGAASGGALADSIGWRWSFFIQIPLCVLAFCSVSVALQLPDTDEVDWKAKIKRIDFLGATALVTAILLLLLDLDRGSIVGWSAKITIVTLSLSAVLFGAFILIETKVAKEPFAPARLLFHRRLLPSYMCNFFSFGGYEAALFYLPLYFQAVDGVSATQAGVRLIPDMLCEVTGSVTSGIYMRSTGRYFKITILAYALLLAGAVGILLFTNLVANSTPALVGFMILHGYGNGVGLTTTLIALISNVEHQDQAVATACNYLWRNLGFSVGLALSASAANQALRDGLSLKLPQLGLPAAEVERIAKRVEQDLNYLYELEPRVRKVVVRCYESGIRAAFSLQVALTLGAAIAAWFVREKRMV